jgi:hypothetical protein
MTEIISINPILTPAYIEEVRQTIALQQDWKPDFTSWDDEDYEIINRREVEEMIRHITIACGGTSFTDFVMSRQINVRRLSDHVLLDLQHDDTLPETFDNLDQFRSYLRSQHACLVVMQLAYPVWRRYQYWLARRARS